MMSQNNHSEMSKKYKQFVSLRIFFLIEDLLEIESKDAPHSVHRLELKFLVLIY